MICTRIAPLATLALCLVAACAGDSASVVDGGRSPDASATPDAAAPDAGGGDGGGASLDLALRARLAPYGLVGDAALHHEVVAPDAKLARLGGLLFFSRTLGGELDVTCASCHHPALAGGDGLSLPVGVGAADPSRIGLGRYLAFARDRDPRADGGPNVPRHAPSIFQASLYDARLYADGRIYVTDVVAPPGGRGAAIRTPDVRLGVPDPNAGAGLVEAAVRFEITSAPQMAGFGAGTREEHRARIVARLRGEAPEAQGFPRNLWLERFREGFDAPAGDADTLLTFERVADAIAAYVRSLVHVDHRFAAYVRGDDAALSDAEKRGALVFYTPTAEGGGGCATCHAGDRFTDERFHVAAFPQIGRGYEVSRGDYGRASLTGGPFADRYAFRTPSLLNVATTAPYGHAGSLATLDDVVAFHTDARTRPSPPDFDGSNLPQFLGTGFRYPGASALSSDALDFLSTATRATSLTTDDRRDLVAFLGSLTDPCLLDASCLARHVPSPSDDPDGQQLMAQWGAPGDAAVLDPGPHPWPGEPASATSSPSTIGVNLRGSLCGVVVQPGAASSSFVSHGEDVGFSHVHAFDVARYASIDSADLLLASAGVSAGDLDGDCHPDLAFASGDGAPGTPLVFYRNAGNGSFQRVDSAVAVPRASLVSGTAIVDLDGDRRSDLVVGELGIGALRVLDGDLARGFDAVSTVPSARSTFGIAAGDLDADTDLDLAVGRWDVGLKVAGAPVLLRNEGMLAFADADRDLGFGLFAGPHRFGFSPSLTDLDGDDALDLLIAADFDNSFVGLQRDGVIVDATDPDVITDANGMGSALADFDGDLDLDWFVTAIDWQVPGASVPLGNRLYRNDGDGRFSDITDTAGVRHGAFGWGACAGDFDNDGDVDLFHVNGFANVPAAALAPIGDLPASNYDSVAAFVDTPPRLFENRGDGTFDDATTSWGLDALRQGRGVSCGDFDRDGDVDLVVAVHSGAPRYFENRRGAGWFRRFLGVRLEGPAGNTAALGARVTVTAGGRTQLREAMLASHHLSHDPPGLHFGLGGALFVDELRVRWPDGSPDTVLTGLPVNRFVTVRHPSLDPTRTLDADRRARLATLAALCRDRIDRADVDDRALTLLGSLARWYGGVPSLDALAAMVMRVADAIDAGLPSLASYLRVVARYLFAVPLADEADLAMQAGTPGLAYRAQHCRSTPLPADFDAQLAAAATLGGGASIDALEGYAAAAVQGCTVTLDGAALAALVDRLVDDVDLGDGTLSRDELRALAVLAHLGREDRIPRPMIEAAIDAAQPDGTFGEVQPLDGSVVPGDDRATAFAAWLFASLTHPARLLEPLAP